MGMHFCFNIKGDPNWRPADIHYYNGDINEIQYVHNTEEYKYLQSVYKDVTGLDLITYHWVNSAPVYVRIFGVLKPGSQTAAIKERLVALEQLAKDYIAVYGDPKFFTPMMKLKIVNKPGPEGYILGYTTVGTKLAVLDAITQCDYDWAKIKYNNQGAWVAMGNILGEEYGTRSNS